jgi:hypothetical protein
MRSRALLPSLLGLGLLVAGCATTEKAGGAAGPVEWKVVDVGRVHSTDGTRTRWSYVMVLKNTSGGPIQFERIDRGTRGQALVVGGIDAIDFHYRLEPGRELRYNMTQNWGWPQSVGTRFGGMQQLGALTVETRFIGKDAQGQAVVVPVSVVLDRGFGRASRQPLRPEPPDLPIKALKIEDLDGLAGRWEGYARIEAFVVPLEALVLPDGAAELRENDPVTYWSRGQLAIREGKVWFAGRESAELAHHQDRKRRMLVGHLTYPSAGGGLSRAPVWFERVGPVPSGPTAARSTVGALRT